MGYDLRQWALDVKHPSLTARTRQVLTAICMIAHDEHGEFYMRGQKFVSEHFPDMSYSAYRNHLTALVKSRLLLKVEHGGGRTVYGGGTTTRYRVNSPKVQNPHPAQGVQPDIVKSPEAQPSNPQVMENQPSASAAEVHQHVDELLAAGITNEQMVEILRAVRETMTGSGNLSDSEINLSGNEGNLSDSHLNLSGKRTGLDEKPDALERNLSGKEGNLSDFGRNLSENRTGYPIKEDKIGIKEDHAAAANLSDSTDENRTGFLETLATTLTEAGHPGIRAAQFTDLTGFLADYTNLTGSPPDQRTAEYIVGRVSETAGIRNVVGFARKITQDVLTTGEGYVAYEPPAPPAPPSERPVESSPPDWELLHLAHGKQMSSAQEIWGAVSERLRGQVSRPAFETWVAEASGAAYAEGCFVVGSANSFASEMLKNRMHPQIEKAVREVAGVELEIEYAVVAPDNRRECPLCHEKDMSVAAS